MKVAAALLCAVHLIGCGGSAQEAADPPARPAGLPRGGYGRIDRMIARAEAQGLAVARTVLPLESVPMAAVPPPLDTGAANRAPVVEDASLRALGLFEVRASASALPGKSDDPFVLRAACTGPGRLLALRGEGPLAQSVQDGALTYLLVDAVYDTAACATRGEPRRTAIRAQEIIAHVVYAFRFVDAQEPGIELLSLVLPTAAITTSRSRQVERGDDVHGDFSRVTLPIRPGGSESLLARISTEGAAAWMRLLAPAEPPPVGDLLLGVELSHAGDGGSHQLLAYARHLPQHAEGFQFE